MRRTRHVTLPVRSWQYVGLLIVSLACLTLGLVSRDREGRHGSLAGPELQHIAPHKVDACPNIVPYSPSIVSDKTDFESSEIIQQAKPASTRRLTNNRSALQNRVQPERVNRLQVQSVENRRFARDSRNFPNNQMRSLQVRSQTRDQVRESRLQDEKARTIRRAPLQIRKEQQRFESRSDLRRLSRATDRIQQNSLRRSRSLDRMSLSDRQRREVSSERRESFLRRSVPNVRISRIERENREMRLNNRREVVQKIRENLQTERRVRDNRQRQSSRIDELNKRIVVNEDRRVNDLSIRRQRVSQNVNSRMEKRDNTRRISRFDEVRNNILNSIDGLQGKREVRARVNPDVAQKYLKQGMTDVFNYEVLQQALIIGVCAIYGSSMFNAKNSVMKRFAAHINRLVSA